MMIKTPEEVHRGSPLFLDLVDGARLIRDPSGFLGDDLGGLRERLRSLGARRIWRGNAWHWELKPDLRCGETITL